MNLFTTMSAGSCFKSFVSLNEFASSCHTSLANFSLSHTKEPELLSLAVLKTTWISWNTLKWNFCGISWTYSAWQPGSLGQSANTQDRGSTDAFSHRVLQGSVAVFYRSVRTSRRKDGLGEWFCCTSSVWPWWKPVCHTLCVTMIKTSLSSRAEEGMILHHFVWKHFNEWFGMFAWGSDGKLCSWLHANQLW